MLVSIAAGVSQLLDLRHGIWWFLTWVTSPGTSRNRPVRLGVLRGGRNTTGYGICWVLPETATQTCNWSQIGCACFKEFPSVWSKSIEYAKTGMKKQKLVFCLKHRSKSKPIVLLCIVTITADIVIHLDLIQTRTLTHSGISGWAWKGSTLE